MRRLAQSPMVRGLAIVAAVALAVVLLDQQEVVDSIGGLLRIAFFLAVAFFLFLVWRERRGELDAWSERSRRVFYAGIALAVIDIGAAIGLTPSGTDVLLFFLVLLACAYAVFRVWRDEHTYSG